jgi:hypothetical protein
MIPETVKPLKIIKAANEAISNLQFKLQYSKNLAKDQKDIDRLKLMASTFQDFLDQQFHTDAIEALLYSIIKDWLMLRKVYDGEPIPLKEICNEIDFTINYGSQGRKEEVISILKAHELSHKIENKTVFEDDYADFDQLLSNLIIEFKEMIQWKKN